MAIQNKTTLKSYFETGDVPTEQQFADLIDSMEISTDVWISCANTITNTDKNKAVTIGIDGKLVLYSRSAAVPEQKGKWELTLSQITQPADQGDTTRFVYDSDDEYQQFDNDRWKDKDSSNQPTDADAELQLIASYINNSYSNILTASVSNSVLTITEVEAHAATLSIQQDPINAISITEIDESILELPERSDKPFIGLIKEVDETNHKCTLFKNGIVEAIAATNIDISSVLPDMANLQSFEDYMYWLSYAVIPVDGGKVRLIDPQTELTSKASALNLLGALGIALSNAQADGKVIVKLLK